MPPGAAMPLSLPKPRPLRPRRRVEPLDPPLREPPVRTYAFDPNAARQAWRQVAKTRGANAMRLDGRDSGSRLAPLALGLAAVIALVLWWSSDDPPAPAESEAAEAVAVADQPREVEHPGLLAEPLAPTTTPEPMEPPAPAGSSTFSEPEADVAPAPPPPRIDRLPPPGTPEHHARALDKLPHSPHDRTPMGGIGPGGMHVDRLTMGTNYEDGACTGPVGKFSVRTEKVAHVCFRVVHPRKVQRVMVRWEHEGRLIRRTLVRIGSTHGYRTRAGLSLRRRPKGNWTARVMSIDGVELASHAFQIL